MLWYYPAFSWQDKHTLSFLSIYLQTITRCDNTYPPHTHTQELYYFSPTVNRRFPVAQLTAEHVWPDVEKVKFHSNSHIPFCSYNWPQFCISQTQDVHEWSVWSTNSKIDTTNYYNHIFTNLATKQTYLSTRIQKMPTLVIHLHLEHLFFVQR